jgi:hypothetical protein
MQSKLIERLLSRVESWAGQAIVPELARSQAQGVALFYGKSMVNVEACERGFLESKTKAGPVETDLRR